MVVATATATIIIGDVNDNSPVFDPKNYVRRVSELAGPGTLIIQVEAKDEDSDAVFAYTLDKEAKMNFTINTEGGISIREQQVGFLTFGHCT